MEIRAKDLAKQIGVSEATLSLVLNNKPGISAKTRTMVEKKVREMGYESMLQKNIIGASKQTISVPFTQLSGKTISFVLYKDNGKLLGMNSFFPLILDGIEATARKYGYTLNVINVDCSNLDNNINYIKESGCSGFVIFATELQKQELHKFEELNMPFVIFDNYFMDRNVYCAKVNNEQGTYIAVKYLYEMGHRKIGYLKSDVNINSFKERQRRAADALRSFGLESERYFYTIGYASEHAEKGMDSLLANIPASELPTAFLTDNDLVAIGAIQSLKKRGYRIPEDFSIIGYDDRPICTLVDPKLTTIQLPRAKFGSAAVDLLIQEIESPSPDCITVEVNGKLIKRNTVSVPRSVNILKNIS